MNPTWWKTLREYAEALIVALVLALVIRAFIVQAFKIPSESMLNTLLVGDHLLVTKFAYGVRLPFSDKVIVPVSDPKRGDVVVFEYPVDPDKDFIKRVIGTPGDVVEIKAKQVFVNGKLLDEPYAIHDEPVAVPNPHMSEVNADPAEYFDRNSFSWKRDWMPKTTVPEGKYFVMGDNRDHSYDSRFWGFVSREAIRGRALIIYWSWDFTGGLTIRWDRLGHMVR